MPKKESASEATKLSYEADRKTRKGWGNISPITRVIDDKRKAKSKKEKEKEIREYV